MPMHWDTIPLESILAIFYVIGVVKFYMGHPN